MPQLPPCGLGPPLLVPFPPARGPGLREELPERFVAAPPDFNVRSSRDERMKPRRARDGVEQRGAAVGNVRKTSRQGGSSKPRVGCCCEYVCTLGLLPTPPPTSRNNRVPLPFSARSPSRAPRVYTHSPIRRGWLYPPVFESRYVWIPRSQCIVSAFLLH